MRLLPDTYLLGTDVLCSSGEPCVKVDGCGDVKEEFDEVLGQVEHVIGIPNVPPHFFQYYGDQSQSQAPWPKGNIMFWPSVSEYPLDPGFYIDDGSGSAVNLNDLDPSGKYGIEMLDPGGRWDESFDERTLRTSGAFRTGTGRVA